LSFEASAIGRLRDALMLKKLGDSWVKAKPHTLAEAKAVFQADEIQNHKP
jgi:hypothetical protein